MSDPRRPRDGSRLDADGTIDLDATTMVASEEELRTAREIVQAGGVRVRKVVDTEAVDTVVERGVEHATVTRTPPFAEDDGEVVTFDDGSVSIPVLEEEVVITKRLVVRERVLIHKHTLDEPSAVHADLRRERIEIDADDEVGDRVQDDLSGQR